SEGAMVAMVDRDAPSTKTEVVRTVEASPKAAVQIPPKPTKKPRVPTPKDVNVTGSIKPTPKNNQVAQAESKIPDKSNHKAPANKPRSYGLTLGPLLRTLTPGLLPHLRWTNIPTGGEKIATNAVAA